MEALNVSLTIILKALVNMTLYLSHDILLSCDIDSVSIGDAKLIIKIMRY